MRLVQFLDSSGERRVGVAAESDAALRVVSGSPSVYDLARAAARSGRSLESLAASLLNGETADYEAVVAERRLLPPLDHPEPSRCLVTGTGLSHLGSAAARDSMHTKLQQDETALTDSMKMFKWGLEGGKPAPGNIGVAPEWFYKGDGGWVVAPEHDFEMPGYALDGGEEAEIVGLYLIGDQGEVLRLGFALGNEFSDHIMERKNYLYLAHSKLRQCSFGPELLLGELPANVSGRASVLRNGQPAWSGEFLSGEDNMAHSIANLEQHHFKYREFRRPGDVHVHFFGAATGSFTAGFATQPGDVFQISAPVFGRALRNGLAGAARSDGPVSIRAL